MSMFLSSCSGERPVATFTHDLGGATALYAYAAEPSGETRAGERAANQLYGMETRSPKTPYVCVWRDTAPGRFGAKAGPPHEIFLTCALGTDAWDPPADMMRYAEQTMRRDQAVVRIGWTQRGDGYAMTRFEVTVKNMAAGRNFRSVSFGDEVATIGFDRKEIVFPKSPGDTLSFTIAASMPQRRNRGEPVTKPPAKISFEGAARPMPAWMNY